MTHHDKDPAHLARMVDDLTPDDPPRWPHGWWILPGLAIGVAMWLLIAWAVGVL